MTSGPPALPLSLTKVECIVSVLDDLKDAPTVKPRLAEWVQSLTDEDRAAWDKAIDDGVASDFLVTVVRNNGGSTTRASIDEWRAKRVRR